MEKMVEKIDAAICALADSIAGDCIAPEYRAETVKALAELVQAKAAIKLTKKARAEGNRATDKMGWAKERLKCLEEIAYASHDNFRKLEGRVSLLEGRGGETEITLLDVVKQLDLDIFSDSVYTIAGMSKSMEEFRARLRKRLTEKELQQFNRAAQYDGNQPLSFSSRQK